MKLSLKLQNYNCLWSESMHNYIFHYQHILCTCSATHNVSYRLHFFLSSPRHMQCMIKRLDIVRVVCSLLACSLCTWVPPIMSNMLLWYCYYAHLQMPEEDAFGVFVSLMSHYKLRELYKPSMADLSLCFYQLETVVEVFTPCTHTHTYIHFLFPVQEMFPLLHLHFKALVRIH